MLKNIDKSIFITASSLLLFVGAAVAANVSGEDSRSAFLEAFLEQDSTWDREIAHELSDRIVNTIEANKFSLSEKNVQEICFGIANLPNMPVGKKSTHPISKNFIEQRLDYIVMNYYLGEKSTDADKQKLLVQMGNLIDRISVELHQRYPNNSDVVDSVILRANQGPKKICFNLLRQNFKKPMSSESSEAVYKYWIEELDAAGNIDDPLRLKSLLSLTLDKGFFKIAKETSVKRLPMPDSLKRAEDKLTENQSLILAWESAKRAEARKKQKEIAHMVNEARTAAYLAEQWTLDDLNEAPKHSVDPGASSEDRTQPTKDHTEMDSEIVPNINDDIVRAEKPTNKNIVGKRKYLWAAIAALLLITVVAVSIIVKRK